MKLQSNFQSKSKPITRVGAIIAVCALSNSRITRPTETNCNNQTQVNYHIVSTMLRATFDNQFCYLFHLS